MIHAEVVQDLGKEFWEEEERLAFIGLAIMTSGGSQCQQVHSRFGDKFIPRIRRFKPAETEGTLVHRHFSTM